MIVLPSIRIALENYCPLILKFVRNKYNSRLFTRISTWGRKHLAYRHFLRQHRYVDSWSRLHVLFLTVYIVANLACILVPLPDVKGAGLRAGTLSLINMIVLYLGPCFSFAADTLRMSLRMYRRVHACVGVTVFILGAFHAIVAVTSRKAFWLNEPKYIWAFIAIIGLLLLVLPLCLFSQALYEVVLFSHQAISLVVIFFTWRHLPSITIFPRLYLYIILGIFLTSFILQSIINILKNGMLYLKARFSGSSGTMKNSDIIRITLYLRKPMKVKPGQYLNLRTLSSPLSLFQRHPFAITSWSNSPQPELELIVKPRQGLTKSFKELIKYGDTTSIASISGPYGQSVPQDQLVNVLLAATGNGIIALIPFFAGLGQKEHGYGPCRRWHLVWQIDDLGKT
ncbi:hypothetical protein BGZ63DRAFT_367500 [Mariannaea sp. PMI_226]|nr:hypothetical protein BGZ63DRAFT_367500 [Mariannaea sp. PMI_226]